MFITYLKSVHVVQNKSSIQLQKNVYGIQKIKLADLPMHCTAIFNFTGFDSQGKCSLL